MSNSLHRSEIARSAAGKLAAAALGSFPAIIGFDGFVDAIIAVVSQRRSMRGDDYQRIETITGFAERCAAAAGKSTNIELVVHEERFGGNGPLMAGGLAQMGLATTYVGAVGRVDAPRILHPLYEELQRRCVASGGGVEPVAPPAFTHALEFDDGKIMLGQPGNIQQVTWNGLKAALGERAMIGRMANARLIGIVNWVMMGGVQDIFDGLTRDVFAAGGFKGRVFIDLCDPAKRTDSDVAAALAALRRMAEHVPVTLGLNLAESERIGAVAGAGAYDGVQGHPTGAQIRTAAERVRAAIGVGCVVIHPREGAAAADASGAAWFDGPLVKKPKLSTGAGDHFNAGFAAGQVIGLSLEECLALGCATSGAYVRDALSPTRERLVEFLRDLPGAE